MSKQKSTDILVPLSNDPGSMLFWCPGCQCAHRVVVERKKGYTGPVWKWNGDREKPTISPSIRTWAGDYKETGCHSFVTDGKIRYLNDCYHDLKGKTIELKPFGEV